MDKRIIVFVFLAMLGVLTISALAIPQIRFSDEAPGSSDTFTNLDLTGFEDFQLVSVAHNSSIIAYPAKNMSPYGSEVNPVYNLTKEALVHLNPANPDNPLSNIVIPGDVVVLKPNFVSASSFGNEGCTRTAVLRPLVDFAVEAGASKVIIAEGPSSPDPEDVVFGPNYTNVTGLVQALQEMYPSVNITYRNLNQDEFTWVDLGENSTFYGAYTADQLYSLRNIRMDEDSYYYAEDCNGYNPQGYRPGLYAIANTVFEADVFVNVPKMKVHHLTGVTLSLKNLVGITVSSTGNTTNEESIKDIPHWNNSAPHISENLTRQDSFENDVLWRIMADLHKIVFYADANGAVNSTGQRRYLSVVDGVIGMEGPTIYSPPAVPRPTGVIVAGENPAAVDAVCSRVMGFNYTVLKSITSMETVSDHLFGKADPVAIAVLGASLTNDTFGEPYVPHGNYEDSRIAPYKIRLQHFDPPEVEAIETSPEAPREGEETMVIVYTQNADRVAAGWLCYSLDGAGFNITKMVSNEESMMGNLGLLEAGTSASYYVCLQDFFFSTGWSDMQSFEVRACAYIRADGGIDPPTAPISSVDNVTYTFTGSMNASFAIERDNIVVDGAGYTIGGNDSVVTISGRNNVTLKDLVLGIIGEENMPLGVQLLINHSSQIRVIGVTLRPLPGQFKPALSMLASDNCFIYGNKMRVGEECDGFFMSQCSNNVIEGNSIAHLQGSLDFVSIALWECSNNSICLNNLGGSAGISLAWSANNSIISNNIRVRSRGVMLSESSHNNISYNSIAAYYDAFPLTLGSSSNNSVIGNTVEAEYGMRLDSSADNIFYHNNCNQPPYNEVEILPNVWDNGYPDGGNYWQTYQGEDSFSGPYQNESGSDGIGDTPLLIAPYNRDEYPLMNPFHECDIAVVGMSPSKTAIASGRSISINATVSNGGRSAATWNLTIEATYARAPRTSRLQANAATGWNSSIPGPPLTAHLGDSIALTLEAADSLHHYFYVDYNSNYFPDIDEPQSGSFMNTTITFDFVADRIGSFTYYCAYYQSTMFGSLIVGPAPSGIYKIGSQNVTLASNEVKNVTFFWNTTDYPMGKYNLATYAAQLLGESNTTGNTCSGGWVFVTILGDVDGDFDVDIFDIVLMAGGYGTKPPNPKYNPNCDIDGDEDIDIFDIVIAAGNYGESWYRPSLFSYPSQD